MWTESGESRTKEVHGIEAQELVNKIDVQESRKLMAHYSIKGI